MGAKTTQKSKKMITMEVRRVATSRTEEGAGTEEETWGASREFYFLNWVVATWVFTLLLFFFNIYFFVHIY